MVIVSAIRCAKCGDVIFSRALHDFHRCSCKTIAIDGGFDYTKICGNEKDFSDVFPLKIDITKADLYKDWNNQTNRYGLINSDEQISSTQLPRIKKIKSSTIVPKILRRKISFECSCGCKFKSKKWKKFIKCPECKFIEDIVLINVRKLANHI